MPETIVVQARFAADTAAAVAGVIPGIILPHGSNTVPTGFLLCDGTAVSRTTYSNLFTAIGTTWGVGDGSTTFNLPDCRGKTLFGKSAAGTFSTLGTSGGSETHIHASGGSHNHFTASGHTHSFPAHTHTISTQANHDHRRALSLGGQFGGAGSFATSMAGSHNHTGATPSGGSGTTDSGFITTGNTAPTVNSASSLNPYVVSQYMVKY